MIVLAGVAPGAPTGALGLFRHVDLDVAGRGRRRGDVLEAGCVVAVDLASEVLADGLLAGDDGIGVGSGALGGRLRAPAAARTAADGFRLLGFLVGLTGELGFLAEQRLTVGLGDLVVVGVDFREGEKSVAVAAVIDEGGLQGRFDPGDLREVDVTGELPLVQRLEVEVFNSVSVHHHDAGLFRVGGIDQHFLCHDFFRERRDRAAACAVRCRSCGGVLRTRAGRPTAAHPRWGGCVGSVRFLRASPRLVSGTDRTIPVPYPVCAGLRPGGLCVARAPVAGCRVHPGRRGPAMPRAVRRIRAGATAREPFRPGTICTRRVK